MTVRNKKRILILVVARLLSRRQLRSSVRRGYEYAELVILEVLGEWTSHYYAQFASRKGQ